MFKLYVFRLPYDKNCFSIAPGLFFIENKPGAI